MTNTGFPAVRRIGVIDLGGGTHVMITATPDVDDEEALGVLADWIEFQRGVLARRAARGRDETTTEASHDQL